MIFSEIIFLIIKLNLTNVYTYYSAPCKNNFLYFYIILLYSPRVYKKSHELKCEMWLKKAVAEKKSAFPARFSLQKFGGKTETKFITILHLTDFR